MWSCNGNVSLTIVSCRVALAKVVALNIVVFSAELLEVDLVEIVGEKHDAADHTLPRCCPKDDVVVTKHYVTVQSQCRRVKFLSNSKFSARGTKSRKRAGGKAPV